MRCIAAQKTRIAARILCMTAQKGHVLK